MDENIELQICNFDMSSHKSDKLQNCAADYGESHF